MFSAHSLAVLCVLIKVHSGKKKKGLFFLQRPNSTSLLISSCSARSQGACGRAVKQIKHGGRKEDRKEREGPAAAGERRPFSFFPQSPANSKWARSDIPSRRTAAVKVNPVALKVCSWSSRGGGHWKRKLERGQPPPPTHPASPTLSN